MGRPFIEFIQAQALEWRPAGLPGRAGAEVRELSADPDSGAAGLLVRYPPGWRATGGEVLAADEELLVLAGDLRVGATTHTRYGYAHLPAGHRGGGMSSVDGAVVLTFFSGYGIYRGPGPAGGGGQLLRRAVDRRVPSEVPGRRRAEVPAPGPGHRGSRPGCWAPCRCGGAGGRRSARWWRRCTCSPGSWWGTSG